MNSLDSQNWHLKAGCCLIGVTANTGLTGIFFSDIKDIYHRIDIDKSGALSFMELRKGLQLLGLNPTVKDVKAIVKRHNIEGSKLQQSILFFIFNLLFEFIFNIPFLSPTYCFYLQHIFSILFLSSIYCFHTVLIFNIQFLSLTYCLYL